LPDSSPYLYLTTRGRTTGRPREVEIWYTQVADTFYIIAEYETSQWVSNLRANSDVQIRVNQSNFAAVARILSPETEPELVRTVQNLSREKYGWGDGLVVQLKPHAEQQMS
jgi:deazaflavin-dependent oxidoreductase (nitroreductase family)